MGKGAAGKAGGLYFSTLNFFFVTSLSLLTVQLLLLLVTVKLLLLLVTVKLFVLFVSFWVLNSLCGPGWPQTHDDHPVSASQCAGITAVQHPVQLSHCF